MKIMMIRRVPKRRMRPRSKAMLLNASQSKYPTAASPATQPWGNWPTGLLGGLGMPPFPPGWGWSGFLIPNVVTLTLFFTFNVLTFWPGTCQRRKHIEIQSFVAFALVFIFMSHLYLNLYVRIYIHNCTDNHICM